MIILKGPNLEGKKHQRNHQGNPYLVSLSVPFHSIFIGVGTVVEAIIRVREVGRVFQGQCAGLACFQILGELDSYLFSGFVLQDFNFTGLFLPQLKKNEININKIINVNNLDTRSQFSLKPHLEGSFGNVEFKTMQDDDFGFVKHQHGYGSVTSKGHSDKIRVQGQVISKRLDATR